MSITINSALNLKDPRTVHRLLLGKEPFLGYIFQGVRLCYREQDHLMSCTYKTIYIQEKFATEDGPKDITKFLGVLIHEMLHIYAMHHKRYGFTKKDFLFKYRHLPWLPNVINMCLDAVINESLINAGYTFMETEACTLRTLLPKDHPRIKDANWNEDDLINYVISNSTYEPDQPMDGSGDGDGDSDEESDSSGSGSGPSPNGKKAGKKGSGKSPGKGGSQPDDDQSPGGSGYTVTLPNGQKIRVLDGDLEISDDGDDPSDIDQQEKTIKGLAKKAAKELKNKNPGTCSGNFIPDDIPDTEKTQLSWEQKLKSFAASATSKKFTTNYREVKQEPLYTMAYDGDMSSVIIDFPYIRKPEPNLVLVMMDLSGSIYSDLEVVRQFCHQISDISKSVGKLLLMTFDDGLIDQFYFDISALKQDLGDLLIKEKEKYMVGGGGTDVQPLFDMFQEKNSKVSLLPEVNINDACMLVVLTDLYIGRPIETQYQPINNGGAIPTVWVCPKEDYSESNRPVFGDLILMDVNRK